MKAKKTRRQQRVGMPASLLLDQFGALVTDAFDGEVPYYVGSSLVGERDYHDVDVRLILSDERYQADGYGDPVRTHHNAKWVAMTLAFSALGQQMTGLPIDFQIQQQSWANSDPKNENQPRSALGIVTHLRNRGSDAV